MSPEAPDTSDAPESPTGRTAPESLVLINTGDGKGKSSAAFGVMARAWARGWKVCVVQFIKSEAWKTGEKKLADHLGIEWWALGDGFTWDSKDMDATEAHGREAWRVAAEKLAGGEAAGGPYDLIILDELTYIVSWGWVPVEDVVAAVQARAPRTNVIITGRNAHPALIDIADTVTEMRKVKHAYDRGIDARRGIEY